MPLLSNFGKEGNRLNLLSKPVDIEDKEYLSKYFGISEFNPLFTAGKNPVAFNGSPSLKPKSEIFVECIDSDGNSLYIEKAKSTTSQFTDFSKFLISVHVYDELSNGPAKLILVGTTIKNEVVRWIGNITIDKTLTNSSKVRLYKPPTLDVTPLLYPVIDTDLANVSFPLPPPPRIATAEATILSKVLYITVTNGGSNFSSTPTVTVTGGGGSGATAEATIENNIVKSISVISAGSGFLVAPTVTITGGGGVNATAEATLSSTIQTITIVDGGYGYETSPTISITGVGSNGQAVATISEDGVVDSITITNSGIGYTSPPTITFSSPPEVDPPQLNVPVNFVSNFYSYAVTPSKNTNRLLIDRKRTTIDYRLFAPEIEPETTESSLYSVESFNYQMEGKPITLYVTKIQLPNSSKEIDVNITSSFIINKVIDRQTISLDSPFFYKIDHDELVTNIIQGTFEVNYSYIQFNTNPDSKLTLELSPDNEVDIKESYAEITYRDIKTYSGRIARHKLYRKSLFYPGDFQLISDEPLGAIELLSDTITFNKSYADMGKAYNQAHTERYFFTSSQESYFKSGNYPLSSLYITSSNYNSFDGSKYVIIKNNSIDVENDNVYYPYDSESVNRLSGQSYNSNFISLKKDTLYVLSADVIMEKDKLEKNSTVSFYFTSSLTGSLNGIQLEKTFDPRYGLKMGEIQTSDETSKKYFSEKQYIYFTPTEDYFGTIVIVPYHCYPTLSNISLKVYGDHGFSPDTLFIRVPFPVNIKNETFEIRAELYDINSNLIYSKLNDVQTFDKDGESLYKFLDGYTSTLTIISGDTNNTIINSNVTNITGVVNIPNLDLCDGSSQRFVAWKFPTGEDTDGKLCYTNVTRLIIEDNDYISLSSFQDGIETTVKSLAIKYDGNLNLGRRIYILEDGTKFNLP